MHAIWILAVLSAPPAFDEGPVVAPVPDPPSAAAAHDRYVQLIRASSRRADPDLYEVTPPLCELYRVLKSSDIAGLSFAERSRMAGNVENRMEELRSRAYREKRFAEAELRRNARRDDVRTAAGTSAGPGEIANAARLIELIETTIAPATWEVNGGQGTIHYFGLLHALVVRQTGEVHYQLGNTLKQLNK